MGFNHKWVGWISQCISTVSFSVLVNGRKSQPFTPTCGLHQGDPLSPYLFILVAQAFSDGLREFASHDICRIISVSHFSPCISHLMFADDCYFFMEYNLEHAWCLKWVLEVYCQQAGQKINFNKSELFTSPNMKTQQMHDLKCIFGVRLVERPGLYLGANLDFSSRKGSLFSRILDRVGSKLSLWKAPLLSFLSRLILVKHVLMSILRYMLSIFQAPVYFLNKVKSVSCGLGREREKGIV